MRKSRRRLTIAESFALGWPIDEAIGRAYAEALRWHQWLGKPVPHWDGEKVVWIDPRTIHLPGETVKKTKPKARPKAKSRRRR